MTPAQRDMLFKIIGSILLLGELNFGEEEEAKLSDPSKQTLSKVRAPTELRDAQTGRA